MTISLAQQIEEIDYELEQRRKVYPRIAAKEPRRRSELEYHVARLTAVRDTLLWLARHESEIKERLGS